MRDSNTIGRIFEHVAATSRGEYHSRICYEPDRCAAYFRSWLQLCVVANRQSKRPQRIRNVSREPATMRCYDTGSLFVISTILGMAQPIIPPVLKIFFSCLRYARAVLHFQKGGIKCRHLSCSRAFDEFSCPPPQLTEWLQCPCLRTLQ